MTIFLKNRNVLEEHWEAHHEQEAEGLGLKTKQKLRYLWGTKQQTGSNLLVQPLVAQTSSLLLDTPLRWPLAAGSSFLGGKS